MAGDDIGNLIYLVVLGCAIAAWFFIGSRPNMNKALQYAAVWGLIFLGVIAGVGLWGDISHSVMPRAAMVSPGTIEVPRARDGHYYLTLAVNGTPTRFVVDTGATGIVLSQSDAEAAGIDTARLAYVGQAMTANGPVRTAQVALKSLAFRDDVLDRDVPAWVSDGAMDGSLLGMSYLQRFEKLEISGGKMILTR